MRLALPHCLVLLALIASALVSDAGAQPPGAGAGPLAEAELVEFASHRFDASDEGWSYHNSFLGERPAEWQADGGVNGGCLSTTQVPGSVTWRTAPGRSGLHGNLTLCYGGTLTYHQRRLSPDAVPNRVLAGFSGPEPTIISFRSGQSVTSEWAKFTIPLRPHRGWGGATSRQMMRALVNVDRVDAILSLDADRTAVWALDEVALHGIRGDHSRLKVTPAGGTLDFGPVAVGSLKEKRITLHNPTPAPVQAILSVPEPYTLRPEQSDFTGTLLPNSRESFILGLQPTPQLLGRRLDFPLEMTLNALGQDPGSRTLQLKASVTDSLLAVVDPVPPEQAQFGQVEVGKKKTLQIKIQNLDTSEKLTVRVMKPPAPFVTPLANKRLKLKPNRVATIPVEFRPTTTGEFAEVLDLRIEGRDPAPEPVFVGLGGTGKGPAIESWLEVLTPEVDIGDVTVGDHLEVQMSFRRKDDRAHLIQFKAEPDGPIKISTLADTLSLAATDPAEFTFPVTYYATDVGSFSTTIRVLELAGGNSRTVGTVAVRAESSKFRFTTSTDRVEMPETIVGQRSTRSFTVTNNSRDGHNALPSFRDPIGAAGWEFSPTSYAPGSATGVLQFKPTSPGVFTNVLRIGPRGGGLFHAEVTVVGRAINPPGRKPPPRRR